MPRYFFNVHDGVSQIDEDGTVLAGIAAARSEALVLAGEIIRDAGRRADLGEDWHIEVRDDTGLTCPIHRCEDVGLSRRRVSSRACGSGRRGAPSGDASVWVRRWREDLISA